MESSLKDLLEAAKILHGVTSGRALATLAEREGLQIDRTTINHILRGTYKHRPGRAVLEAIADLAGVEPAVAYRAAGVPLPGPPFAEELPPDVDYLKPAQRNAVITVIRAFLAEDAVAEPRNEGLPWEEREQVLELVEEEAMQRVKNPRLPDLTFVAEDGQMISVEIKGVGAVASDFEAQIEELAARRGLSVGRRRRAQQDAVETGSQDPADHV